LNKTSILQDDALDAAIAHPVKPIAPVGHDLALPSRRPGHGHLKPRLYGGTERVVSHLTEELVCQGHDVSLFASADSQTNADLQTCCEQALRLDPKCKDPLHITWHS